MNLDSDSQATVQRRISRRTVVKAGAHAAWVVPAVQLIGSAPAMAASGCTTSLNVVASWANDRLTLTITNTSNQPVSGLTVSVGFSLGNPKYVSHTPANFTKSSSAKKSFTFTDGTLAPHATITLSVQFSNVPNGKNGTAAGEAGGTVSGGQACPAPYSVSTRS